MAHTQAMSDRRPIAHPYLRAIYSASLLFWLPMLVVGLDATHWQLTGEHLNALEVWTSCATAVASVFILQFLLRSGRRAGTIDWGLIVTAGLASALFVVAQLIVALVYVLESGIDSL